MEFSRFNDANAHTNAGDSNTNPNTDCNTQSDANADTDGDAATGYTDADSISFTNSARGSEY